jgi:hypothetical protein
MAKLTHAECVSRNYLGELMNMDSIKKPMIAMVRGYAVPDKFLIASMVVEQSWQWPVT